MPMLVTWLLLLLGIGLGILGLRLLIRGRWPKRTGDTPHCRVCDYILIGNESGICPECGTKITPETTIYGERHTRPWRVFTGAALMLVGLVSVGVFVGDRVGHVPWYQHCPFGWVLHDLGSTSPTVSWKAFGEITRRQTNGLLSLRQQSDWVDQELKDVGQTPTSGLWDFQWYDLHARAIGGSLSAKQLSLWTDRVIYWNKHAQGTSEADAIELRRLLSAGTVSPEQRNAAIEFALALQVGPPGYYQAEDVWMEMLADQCLAHNLTPNQETRFFDNMMQLSLKTRAVVNPAAKVPYRITVTGRGPDAWRCLLAPLGQWVDDKKIARIDCLGEAHIRDYSLTSVLPPQLPGRHRFRIKIAVRICNGWPHNPQTVVLRSRELDVASDFDVPPEAKPIALVKTPDAAALAQCIQAIGFYGSEASGTWLQGHIRVNKAPVDVAFEVFARTSDGHEYALGRINAAKDNQWRYKDDVDSSDRHHPTTPPAKIDIILRSNPAAAEETVEMTEIWDGEIIIPNVPVQSPATQPSRH